MTENNSSRFFLDTWYIHISFDDVLRAAFFPRISLMTGHGVDRLSLTPTPPQLSSWTETVQYPAKRGHIIRLNIPTM